jgi:hypothetical protein
MTWAPSHGQQSEDERVGEQSSLFGAGYDQGTKRRMYEIGQDGREDNEPEVQGPLKSELLRYPDGARGLKYVRVVAL